MLAIHLKGHPVVPVQQIDLLALQSAVEEQGWQSALVLIKELQSVQHSAGLVIAFHGSCFVFDLVCVDQDGQRLVICAGDDKGLLGAFFVVESILYQW